MTYESEAISRAFYEALTPAGLAGRTRTEWDEIVLHDLAELLPPASRILDIGCGYGRLALPLAIAGHSLSGLDLSPAMIEAARENAAAAGLSIPFEVGSMTDLPYEEASFDVVLCLWSAFHELLEVDAQTAAIREMSRVLADGGFGLIEGPPYTAPTAEEIASGYRRGHENRVRWDMVEGGPNPHYLHDEHSFTERCRAAGVKSFEVRPRDWGGRPRLILRLGKPHGPSLAP
ncbi:MAG: methyltransferase domain-containing protein [Candidatus Limnocylindrales bacterium]